MTFLRNIITLFLICLVLRPSAAFCEPWSDTKCPNSTVEDAWGPEFASGAKVFFAELQSTVEKNDTAKFASMVHYPVRVFNGKRSGRIATSAQLIRQYAQVMTPAVRAAILNQSAACLFGNGQGVMIGTGEIWFAEQPNREMKIITINADAPR